MQRLRKPSLHPVRLAPPGVGKTVVGTYLVAERGCCTLVLVHRRQLLDQWLAQLSLFLGIDPKDIGQIGAGKKTGNGRLDVAMIQSLVRKEKVQDVVTKYGQVIVDECHHLPAVSFERVLAEVKARYIVGLTATPQRRDGHHPVTEMQLGPGSRKNPSRSLGVFQDRRLKPLGHLSAQENRAVGTYRQLLIRQVSSNDATPPTLDSRE